MKTKVTEAAKPTHTPGPWNYRQVKRHTDEHPSGLYGFIVNDATNTQVAEAFPLPHPVAVNEANARLIAAAPDLLAALKFVQPFLRHVAEENSSVDRMVRAAIAKATEQGGR